VATRSFGAREILHKQGVSLRLDLPLSLPARSTDPRDYRLDPGKARFTGAADSLAAFVAWLPNDARRFRSTASVPHFHEYVYDDLFKPTWRATP
jgi:hypothetical protein